MMNEQLNNALAEVLKASKDGVVNIALFAQQQAPDLAREIIQWGFWSHLLWCFLSPAIVFILYRINVWVMKKFKEIDSDSSGIQYVIFWFIGGIIAIFFIINTFIAIETTIKCVVAPKLYLMDYVKDFIMPKSK